MRLCTGDVLHLHFPTCKGLAHCILTTIRLCSANEYGG